MRRECLPQNIDPISPTPKSILGITWVTTKVYQVTKLNPKILLCTSCLTFLPNSNGQACAYRQIFYLHNVLHTFPRNLICNMTFFRIKCFDLWTPSRCQGCVNRQNICFHGVLCFFSLCSMTTVREKKDDILTPSFFMCSPDMPMLKM